MPLGDPRGPGQPPLTRGVAWGGQISTTTTDHAPCQFPNWRFFKRFQVGIPLALPDNRQRRSQVYSQAHRLSTQAIQARNP